MGEINISGPFDAFGAFAPARKEADRAEEKAEGSLRWTTWVREGQ